MTTSEYRHNMPRAFKTKYEENESDDILITYLNGLNLYETSKNKAYQYMSNRKAKLLFYLTTKQLEKTYLKLKI